MSRTIAHKKQRSKRTNKLQRTAPNLAPALKFSVKVGSFLPPTPVADAALFPIYAGGGKKTKLPSSVEQVMKRFPKSGPFVGEPKTLQFIRFWDQQSENLLLMGLGEASALTVEKLRQSAALAYARCRAEKLDRLVVWVDAQGLSLDEWTRGFAEGLAMSAYRFNKHKSQATRAKDAEYTGPSEVVFVCHEKVSKAAVEKQLVRATQVAEALRITKDWSNEPSNVGTPTYFAGEAQRLAKKYGLKCRVLDERACARENMALYLSVGRGSDRENRFVVLEYIPRDLSGKSKTIALVGKGVTFDTGGISIKPALSMEDMKHDMTGAATMMGAIALASMWKAPNRVVAYLAFTENMPSGTATNPGDIVTARSGKTVEIINTDAEGRLVLADALDYAQDGKPDVLIDAATLTGAVGIALGKQCCAVMGNNQELIETLKDLGDKNHERMWELPLFDEYLDDIRSEYADLRNVGPNGLGGTIRAAVFLKQFIRPKTVWAHLDIAYTAYDVGHLPYNPKKGATGAHVRTLAQLALEY